MTWLRRSSSSSRPGIGHWGTVMPFTWVLGANELRRPGRSGASGARVKPGFARKWLWGRGIVALITTTQVYPDVIATVLAEVTLPIAYLTPSDTSITQKTDQQ